MAFSRLLRLVVLLYFVLCGLHLSIAAEPETLPLMEDGARDFDELWRGFDPRAEPLEVELLKEWEQDGVLLRIVRFRIGVFKGKVARLAAVYGFPISSGDSNSKPLTEQVKLPGLVQIHGGGQYADYRACLANAKRGYATVSIAWAGRIMAPEYTLRSKEVQEFWQRDSDDSVLLTTDWGSVDGYHAPSRNPGNAFPSAKPAEWTLDSVESGRNSGWFLCAMAARRALTFMEQQPEVDSQRLGVYGHSMGGKLTVLTSIDGRVKAAVPSCGGISDRYNASEIFRRTLGDDQSLRRLTCPILFLSPSNDFHGRIGDLRPAVESLESEAWRVSCSPHHNHQDTSEFEAGTLLWFDQYLKNEFQFPSTPLANLALDTADGIAQLEVTVDASHPVDSIDVYYTQQGVEGNEPIERAKHRLWHHAGLEPHGGSWIAKLPVLDTDQPLWAYANVRYQLESSKSGVGYYYREYETDHITISSLMETASVERLKQAGIRATLKRTPLIEDFGDGWEHHWFSYRPKQWGRTTHKLNSPVWAAPANSELVLRVSVDSPNTMVVVIDSFAAEVPVGAADEVAGEQEIRLLPQDFSDCEGNPMPSWDGAKRLTLAAQHSLRPKRGQQGGPRKLGGDWNGEDPEFRQLRWEASQR